MIYKFISQYAEDFWRISGSFGVVSGAVEEMAHSVSQKKDGYTVCSKYTEDENGVVSRRGTFTNTSGSPVSINYCMSKFMLQGGEYEVYTQMNTWQNECLGRWQDLVTGVTGETRGLRSAYGGAPFFAIWNRQTSRGYAFHIITKQPWKYEVKYTPNCSIEPNDVEIEIGLNGANLAIELAGGETLELPEILFYEFRNKLDMDCFKLHHYINTKYPREAMPVMYNTWMYKFQFIDFENVENQIQAAKDLGIEYFVIDAAWFGQGNFWDARGDWYENTQDAFRGRMAELSRLVRDNGMKFGFWLEIESAGFKANVLKDHGDYYFTFNDHGKDLYFFDFANKEAWDYLMKTICEQIDKYHIRFIKFDFNQDVEWDVHQSAFRDYFRGYDRFMQTLKEKYPDLHMECCASGGMRMSLASALTFDSIWISDNHSPYEGMRIFKDALLRMPPQLIDKWAVIESVCDFKHGYGDASRERLFCSNDATWGEVRGLELSYLEGFFAGSPLGFSCDLNSLSDTVRASLKTYIAKFKEDRGFWSKAVCRILTDTDSVTVLQYSDMSFDRAEIVIYTNRIRQRGITVYPQVDMDATYCVNGGERMTGKQIDAQGIPVVLEGNFRSVSVSLKKSV